jgi:hypothetical protein
MIALTEGHFDGNVYTNDFYGFTFTKPDDFEIASADRAETLRQSYKSVLPFNAPDLYISYLISHQDPGSIDVSEFFLLSAKLDPSISTLTPVELIGKVADDPQAVKIGGVDFGMASMNSSLADIHIKNSFYCTFRNGYVLMFVIMSTNDEEAAKGLNVLKSIQFK